MRAVIPLVLWLTVACDTQPNPNGPSSSPRGGTHAADWVDDPLENSVLQVVADAEATLLGSDGSELAVGLRCGLAPWPSVRPWFAVRYLLAAHQEALMRRIVDEAPTSEGRIWAAYGLVEARQFDDEDLIDIANEDQTPTWICDGCVSRLSTPAEAIKQL